MAENTKILKPTLVEVETRKSAKGNHYTVLSVTVKLANDTDYKFETFLSNEQKALFELTK